MNAAGAAPESKRLEPILSQISTQVGSARHGEAQAFAAHFFRHVPADDIEARDAAEWARIATQSAHPGGPFSLGMSR